MKKVIPVFVICICLFAGCSSISFKKAEPSPTPIPITQEDLSKIDSSTGAYPMAVALANNALNINNADELFTSSKTVQAGKNVVDGTKDIAFAPYPGDEVLNYAKEKGVELECVKIANNAFVFMVNDKNPVNGLTSQQVRDIYSGKIKKWSEVGGENAEIVPLQRNEDSGSQVEMKNFMGSTKLLTPYTEYTIGSMADIVDNLRKPFDGTKSAIGYTFLYYVTSMVESDGIKLLDLDGVTPSKENIINETYPLISPYYAIIRKDSSEDSMARRWVNYILSDEGQNVIESANYVRVK